MFIIKWLVNLLINGLAILITAYVLEGIAVNSYVTAIMVSLVLGLVNTFIKPIILLFTLPITILSLGLFTFVINALLILIVSNLVVGFMVDGFVRALLFSLVLSIVNSVLHFILR